MKLTSSAFQHGGQIPAKHTCEGADVSPPLEWTDVPEGATSLAIICDDPDAPGGTFTHWLAWEISPGANALSEGEKPAGEGRNDFGREGYGGPCPPRGHGPHRYFFRLYALGAEPELRPGAEKREVEGAVAGALAVAELMGTFERA